MSKKNGGTRVGGAGDRLENVMGAFHENTRIVLVSGNDRAKDCRVIHQFSLQDGGDFVPLGHHIVGHQALLVRQGQGRLQRGEVLGANNPGLVRQHIQSRLERSLDFGDFDAVAAGQHDDIAGTRGDHLFQRAGAPVNIQFPTRGMVRPAVELLDELQMSQQIRAERGVNGNRFGNSRQHLFLHQSRMEVRWIEHDQADEVGTLP